MPNKLLVVDDDPTLLHFLAEFLTNEGFEVTPAHNGSEALRLAYRDHPELVILDVMMPGMDGWETTARLREMSNIPIILLTAKSSEADKLRGFRLGVDDYVIKPFSFAELVARIQAVLNRARAAGRTSVNRIPIGELMLDLDRHEVRRAGQLLQLTPTEYHLLEVLAHHEGHAVSEADLMQEVWGSAYRQEDTTTVRRYIFLLRQKVEADPSHPQLILTVRGFGYRLNTGAAPSTQETL